MEGQVLGDIFEGARRTTHVEYAEATDVVRDRGGVPALDPAESRMLEDRLRDLGYL
jgi:hypothetical protein